MAATHVAFMRAINVGGRRMPMTELVAAFAPLGFEDVRSFQATGNVLFGTDPARSRRNLENDIAGVLAVELGFEVPTIVRTADEVRQVVTATPFTDDQLAATAGKVQVAFVRDAPDDDARDDVAALCPDDDLLAWHGDDLFWLPREGISTSQLPVARIERRLGPLTIRTQRSVGGVAKRLD